MSWTTTIYSLILAISTLISTTVSHPSPSPSLPPNKVAGTWLLVSANITANGTTFPSLGRKPEGVLILAPSLYFSELISVDPSTLPRFPSNTNRSSGTCAEDAAVLAGTLGSYGTYTVDEHGDFETDLFLGSTFPNYIGMHGNSSTINETVGGNGMYLHESLVESAGVRLDVLWRRAEDRTA